jgi:hypothetical protein
MSWSVAACVARGCVVAKMFTALPRSCRGLQSRHFDARVVRRRHAEGAANVSFAFMFVIQAADTIAFAIIAASDAETTALIVAVTGEAA